MDNFASPCAAGVSIQQEGANELPVLLENCVFRNNRAQVTGAAIDLLAGSAAVIRNCLLVTNAGNAGMDPLTLRGGPLTFTNNGVLTIFTGSRAVVDHCTFTGNRNAVDDMGGRSEYRDCIFSDNTLATGLTGTTRYEIDLLLGGKITGCVFHAPTPDLRTRVPAAANRLDAPPPRFTADFIPTDPAYARAGYRPRLVAVLH